CVEQNFRVGECLGKSKMRRIVEPYPIGLIRASTPRSDLSSSCGSEKLYGNASIDPPNGLARCGEFVSVITSCRSPSRRWAMYLPEKPKAPVTAIRTLAFRQAEKITHSARYRNAPNGWLFPANRLRLRTGKDGNERARLSRSPRRRQLFLWHGTKVERALPNGTSRDRDGVDLTS